VTLTQLPALQVILPLIAAPVCLLLRSGRLAWLLSILVSTTALIIAVLLLRLVLENGTVIYSYGGWAAPWGIEYRVDIANAFVLAIVAGISTVVLLFSRVGASCEIKSSDQSLFYTAYLLCLTGLLGMTATGDAFNLFVFLEISSLSSYVLIAMGPDRRGLTAAYQYLIMGTIGATFILIAVGLLYMITGTLNMADLANRIPALTQSRTLRVAFAFLTVGIGLKLALFPLHLWLPNAYTYAPHVVSAFLAATATKVAVYVLLRFMYGVFGSSFAFDSMPLQFILVTLGAAAVLSGSMIAVFQHNIKRMLAYSAIAHVGFFLLGILTGEASGYASAMAYILIYAVVTLGAFGVILALSGEGVEADLIEDYSGLNQSHPWVAFIMLLLMFSLAGIPPTIGFYAKLSVLQAVVKADMTWVAVVAVVLSVIGAFYYLRIVKVMYFDDLATSHSGLQFSPKQDARILLTINGLAVVVLMPWIGKLTTLCEGAIGVLF